MCSNKTTPPMNTKRRPRAKKSRTKAKKQKFLSLRLQFPANDQKRCDSKTKQLSEMRPDSNADVGSETHHHQLDLNQVEDRESHDHENDVAYFFAAADGGDTSLTGLLDASAATESNSSHATNIGSRVDDLSHSSASLPYAYGGQDSESGAALVRNALRNRERDSSEEKWVCYSEVVERRMKEEEVTSSAVDLRQDGRDPAVIRRLSLKLDYQEILNAWSDKGPLYIHGDSSRIVPDVNNDLFSHEASNNGVSWGCNGGLWTVPEMVGDIENGDEIMRLKNEEEELKIGRREASVLRYKEKRQNRLFSKKVRYEVRKLNAEKRPRIKGRFVKRS